MNQSGIRDLKIDDITEFYGKPSPLSFYPDPFKIPMAKNLKRDKKAGETKHRTLLFTILQVKLLYYSTIVPVYNDKGQLDYIMLV